MCPLFVVFVDTFGRSNDEMIQKAYNLALTLFFLYVTQKFSFFCYSAQFFLALLIWVGLMISSRYICGFKPKLHIKS